jgi:hypothetical protein
MRLILVLFFVLNSCSQDKVRTKNDSRLKPLEPFLIEESGRVYNHIRKYYTVIENSEKVRQFHAAALRVNRGLFLYLRKHKQLDLIKNYKWKYDTIRDPRLDTWYYSGGKFLSTTAFVSYFENEYQAGYIAAHLLAHDLLGHHEVQQAEGIKKGVAFKINILTQEPEVAERQIGRMSDGLEWVQNNHSYNAAEEMAADRLAMKIMGHARLDAREAPVILEKLLDLHQTQLGVNYLIRHPADTRRIRSYVSSFPSIEGL